MEDGKTQSVSPQVEGVPEGWRLVRIGRPRTGEFYITGTFRGKERTGISEALNDANGDWYAIVEPLPEPKPVCTWPGRPGVLTLSKGWVARNTDGRVWFYNKKPYAVENIGQWDLVIAGGGMARQLGHGLFTDLPVFNPDLPWTEHIVEVGGEETVVVKDVWNGTTMEIQGKMCEPMDCVEIGPIISPYPNLGDGWVSQDMNGLLFWFEHKPYPDKYQWIHLPQNKLSNCHRLTRNEVTFPSSWPWDQRIVRIVGNQIVRDE